MARTISWRRIACCTTSWMTFCTDVQICRLSTLLPLQRLQLSLPSKLKEEPPRQSHHKCESKCMTLETPTWQNVRHRCIEQL